MRSANDQGISRWRQIEAILAQEIARGAFGPSGRLPPATDLAARFGVNRLTVLRAIRHLEEEGIVSVEQGRGTFVSEKAVSFRLGGRARFEENILENQKTPRRVLISVEVAPADERIAALLELTPGQPVAVVCLLSVADAEPVSYGFSYLPMDRLPGVDAAFRAAAETPSGKLSVTEVLASLGVPDYRRKFIRIRARPPNPSEIEHLKISFADYVMEAENIHVDPAGVPIMYGHAGFASNRVEFLLDLSRDSARPRACAI
jgi:GntR family phosphonate transport system transcriptional regulator